MEPREPTLEPTVQPVPPVSLRLWAEAIREPRTGLPARPELPGRQAVSAEPRADLMSEYLAYCSGKG